ncbi:LysR substrate-binding domain-containing protein [Geminicoccus harenae]|uniref:LysR substrate-binding domain-containing protein n=1 Tax=Geminicoccus harenae TaxID=2498453 RepID=UPI00210426B5|nr:LysR substrate-binding domain-containing protein [Geminicoccus harenae]
MSLAHQAALHAAGAAILPMAIARPDIEAGRLRLWGGLHGRGAETWILYASRRLQPKKVGAFVRFVREAFPDQHL